MALANDNYYGYALKLLVEKRITWLECAAASLVWTTIMVYYLEAPYGHLMLEEMEGAQARTAARGSLFSFELPWDDVSKRCKEAETAWHTAAQAARQSCALPHDEDVLATLVNVHIVGGSVQTVTELEGATMRTAVVLALIAELRNSGYPGYRGKFNSDAAVRERCHALYGEYGEEPFVPSKVREAAEQAFRAKLKGPSLLFDKRATPEEPRCATQELFQGMRPLSLVGQASGKSASMAHHDQEAVFARYQTVEVTTGSTLTDQFQPQYLGLAYPFTLPLAVGGYDVPGKPRWRRPDEKRLSEQGAVLLDDPFFNLQIQTSAAEVKLFDITRSLPRRIEAQFRRHWNFVPGLWNLYFRNQVNQGASLGVGARTKPQEPQEQVEQDAAMAASALYHILQHGFFRTQQGARRSVAGDLTKLPFAEGVTAQQKRLLADFRFRTRLVPGTQEIRSTLGHVCFWSSIVYGNGIFMTVTPGERHNYLSIRLSRYRRNDPYVTAAGSEPQEERWIGARMPSLEAREQDVFEREVPGYNLRRLILARDPLAASLAFAVQIRLVLATILGFRMCPNCPHCAETRTPCMDAFGSCAEAMGGIAGRCDGIAGAVECQKSKGSLHLHFWCYVQRLHQFLSLDEISKMLEEALVSADDLKRYTEHLCNESYPVGERLEEEVNELEKRWPCFKESDEVAPPEPVPWGDCRFGRIPPFVWEDTGPDYSSLRFSSSQQWEQDQSGGALSENMLHADAHVYEQRFARALQENLKCAQHHIHPQKNASEERTIPNACLSSKSGKECKAGFPQDKRVNLEQPVLLCKGLAKKKGLPFTGRRSVLGQILGRRNSPWLDGTAPGMAIALSGSNTDVKINDLLPITPVTHESSACTRNCIPRDPVKRQRVIRRLTQSVARTQSQRNGYFGGYICKRQQIGKLEARKCIDKMQKLRELHKGKSEFQQQRAVSGRMITDIEMNGTIRGAVEEFHLCTNLHKNDALFAECIRSFPHVTVDAQKWLHRLEMEIERVAEMQVTAMVPPAKKPQIRSRKTIPHMDIYGFRALNTPFSRLSAFEFLRYWTAEALDPPSNSDANSRTVWTDAGRRLLATGSLKDGISKLSPGLHYSVVESPRPGDEYWVFPREPQAIYAVLRHSWVIVRRQRPYVPVLEGAKVPNATTSPTDSAKYFSLFFRPWTFVVNRGSQFSEIESCTTGDTGISHFAMLGLQHLRAGPNDAAEQKPCGAVTAPTSQPIYHKKLNSPEKPEEPGTCKSQSNFPASWPFFLQTGVHSYEAAQLIRTLLTNAMPTRDITEEDCAKADESGADEEIPALVWRPEDMRALLQRGQAAETGYAPPAKRLRVRQKSTHKQAMSMVESMWGSTDVDPLSCARKDCGPRHIREAAAHLAARNQQNDNKQEMCPYSKKRLPSATLYPMDSGDRLATWLAKLQHRSERPTAEQLLVLGAIVGRITAEAATEQNATLSRSSISEPLLDMVHGQPGCGKSRLIGWIREAFEEVLGWQHGVQFVCLAFQNTMAAQIAGETIHHWSGIPVVEADGGAAARDPHKLSTKCQLLRWILIDEISMVSAQLFGQLEMAVSKVVRRKSEHMLDADGHVRPFGGINMLLFGDMWQLKPVTGLALFASPSDARSQTAYLGCMLIWKSLRCCWEIAGSKRCNNPWYNDVLRQCRNGHLTEEAYWYLHGQPTGTPSCFSTDGKNTLPTSGGSCPCLHALCSVDAAREQFVRLHRHQSCAGPSDALELYQPWVQRFVNHGATGDELMASECAGCRAARVAHN